MTDAAERHYYILVFKEIFYDFWSTPENALAILHKLNEETGHHKTSFYISVDDTDHNALQEVAEEISYPVAVYSRSLGGDSSVPHTPQSIKRKGIPNLEASLVVEQYLGEGKTSLIIGWALFDCTSNMNDTTIAEMLFKDLKTQGCEPKGHVEGITPESDLVKELMDL